MGVLDNVNLHLVNDTDSLAKLMSWLGERRSALGVDTETGGFSFHRDRLRLIQFGDTETGWALPWERWSGAAIEILNKYEAPIVLHNAPFDSRFIVHHSGKDLKRWKWEWTDDTMTMAHLLDPLRPKGLKPLAGMHIDSAAVQAQSQLDSGMADNKWTWDTVPIDYPPYWIYGAMDPVLTCRLREKFMPEVQRSYQDVYNLEMGTLRVVTNMMLKGARVNLDYCHEAIKRNDEWIAKALEWTREEFGVTSSMANEKIANAFNQLSVDIPHKLTKGGSQSMDKEVLEGIDHPLAETILNIRRMEKQVGPYFRHFVRDADENDRVHPTIWALGTRTARMSISDPALQTLPRKDPTVRRAFVPSEGNALISIDADQIEARLMAHFSQDVGMKAAFAGATDFFVALTRAIFSDDSIIKSDPRRDLTKGVVYGKLYGAGPPTMARSAKVPLEQMLPIVRQFEASFPGVKRLQDNVNAVARQRAKAGGKAFIVTPMGRRLVADDDKEYTMVNYLLQCHAAEIFKQNLLKLDAAGFGEHLVLPVHDEVILDAPADEAEDILKEAEGIMNDDTGYFVPITWSGEVIHKNWGEKYE